jgi:hypothetical protein
MRNEAVKKAFEAVQYRLEMTLEQFEQLTKDFEVDPIIYQGQIVGAMMVYGKEIHCCVDPALKGKWFGRSALRTLSRVIKQHGEATSSATTEDGKKLLLSLGFEQDGEIYRSRKTWA